MKNSTHWKTLLSSEDTAHGTSLHIGGHYALKNSTIQRTLRIEGHTFEDTAHWFEDVTYRMTPPTGGFFTLEDLKLEDTTHWRTPYIRGSYSLDCTHWKTLHIEGDHKKCIN